MLDMLCCFIKDNSWTWEIINETYVISSNLRFLFRRQGSQKITEGRVFNYIKEAVINQQTSKKKTDHVTMATLKFKRALREHRVGGSTEFHVRMWERSFIFHWYMKTFYVNARKNTFVDVLPCYLVKSSRV